MSQLKDYTKHKIIFIHEQNVGIREIGRRLNIAVSVFFYTYFILLIVINERVVGYFTNTFTAY